MKQLSLFSLLLLFISCDTEEPTEVLVLPTLHAGHQLNMNYSYEDLMQIIDDYEPEVIGVEIRPEDMELASSFLDEFYPQEMIRVRDSFPEITTGIDYYSEGAKNREVSRELFTDTTLEVAKIKKLASQMRTDPGLGRRYQEMGLPAILAQQRKVAMDYSAEEFLKGKYDSLVELQYKLEDSLYENTIYETYSRFNKNRDVQITKNALELIRQNPEKRILILVGANHRNRLVDSITENYSEEIELVETLNFKKKKD